MAFDPTTIGKAQSNLPPRIIISGEPKSGKTTWASKAPNPIFIPIVGEEGCNDIIDKDGNRVESYATPVVTSYKMLLDILVWLRDGEHNYKTVIIDSLSTLDRLGVKEIIESGDGKKSLSTVNGGYGAGSSELEMKQRSVTQLLSEINEKRKAFIICIAHISDKEKTDQESMDTYSSYDLALNKKVTSLYTQWADMMLFCSKGRYLSSDGKVIETERKLVIHGKAHLPVGGRSVAKLMPKEVDLTWDAFYTALKSAKTQTNKGE